MAAILKAKGIGRSSASGSDTYLAAVAGGQLSMIDFFGAMAVMGRMFTVNAGLVTTPVTWTAAATIDITKPAFFMIIPGGVAVIPVTAWLYMEAFGTSAQFETNMVIGTGGSLTSGGTARTPINVRTDSPMGSACTFYEGGNTIATVGSTANINRIYHDGAQFTITKTAGSATVAAGDQYKWKWSAIADGGFHIAGPNSQIAMHQGSQAGTGFAGMTYVEVPSGWLP